VAVFRPGGHDLNLRAAYIHLVGDALGSIGVIVTGIVIVTTGWRYADPLVGVLIGIFLVVSSWGVLRDSTMVLLEATPRGLDAEVIGHAIAAQPGVVEVHDLHVWQITSGFPSLSAHVLVREGDDCHGIRRTTEHMLAERFKLKVSNGTKELPVYALLVAKGGPKLTPTKLPPCPTIRPPSSTSNP